MGIMQCILRLYICIYIYMYVHKTRVGGFKHMHVLHSSCSSYGAFSFGICIGAPRGIASVGCWMGTVF